MALDFKNRNVIILAPHTDDGELGCGGTIVKMLEMSANVYYVAFSTAEKSLPKRFPSGTLKSEVKRATEKLGIKKSNLFIYDYEVRKLNYVRQEILEELIKLKHKIHADFVFMPSMHDIHQDHSTVAIEGLRAFKNTSILGYELIWNNLTFDTICFVKLEERHIIAKIEALQEYKSQSTRKYTSPEFIRSLAITRGTQIGNDYAEAFEVVRWVW
ncbi:MAG: PIG-L family deacetylase [Candidatus Carbobacillus sp.]|nr:PIG-L family deacetylase [Bacteroidales bacterium]MDD4235024.1 PIG-L family deacetylase [Bacteroidales bacterium]MDY0323685.1 PIG-L family deacetylase [Candidatus Carbobacillus sp.]HRW21731.1 PIG-L family deacetylase [Bacteroidales bacterium]